MSKIYEANNELVDVFKKHGFIETTSEIEKLNDKKSFKLPNAQKKIYFDHKNIKIGNSSKFMDQTIQMTEKKLKSVLLYFKLKTEDFKELSTDGVFKFTQVEEKLEVLYRELEDLKEFNYQKLRQNKISRILNTYESIII